MPTGFDNDMYLRTQSEHIRERIASSGGKLYLEFGGKLFDDYHASRVLPGFMPDSKIRMLMEFGSQAEASTRSTTGGSAYAASSSRSTTDSPPRTPSRRRPRRWA